MNFKAVLDTEHHVQVTEDWMGSTIIECDCGWASVPYYRDMLLRSGIEQAVAHHRWVCSELVKQQSWWWRIKTWPLRMIRRGRWP